MGVTGLYAFLNNRHPEASTAMRFPTANDANETGRQHILLCDGNGLYHYLVYKYLSSHPRSLGGEWNAFYLACTSFFSPFIQLGIHMRIMFDGCTSLLEAKELTRVKRMHARVEKMVEFKERLYEDTDTDLPTNCFRIDPGSEQVLPVPAGTLLAFVQILHSLGIPTWTADGENDEHLAAIALHMAKSNVNCCVDILGQDSDFLVLELASRSESCHDSEQEGGYIPLDSLRFSSSESEDSCADPTPTVTCRRYTSASILAALRLPRCLLPTLACLIGNDSELSLERFHAWIRSPAFHRTVQQASVSYTPSKGATSGSSSSSSASNDANGGFANGTQLVEAVLAFMHWCVKTAGKPSLAPTNGKNNVIQTDVQAQLQQDHLLSIMHRIFGLDATREIDGKFATSALQKFSQAQEKYSLVKFFHPTLIDRTDVSDVWNRDVFDPGFPIAIAGDESDEAEERIGSESTSTTILLPSTIQRSHSLTQTMPQILSVFLTRAWQSSVVLGDVMHPCVVHTLDENGNCALTTDESRTHSRSDGSAGAHICMSQDECASGIRKRVYEALFFGCQSGRPMRIHRLRINDSSTSSLAAVSSMITGLAHSVSKLFVGQSSVNSAALPTPHSANSAAPASITISERIHVIPTSHSVRNSNDADQVREASLDVILESTDYDRSIPAASTAADSSTSFNPEWLTLMNILDTAPDLPPFTSNKLPALSTRLIGLSHALSPLSITHTPLVPLVLTFRAVLLTSLRPLLSGPFSGAAIGEKIDPVVQSRLDRTVIGANALCAQFAVTYLGTLDSNEAADDEGTQHILSLEALSLSHAFMDTYQWTIHAIHTVKMRENLKAEVEMEGKCDEPSTLQVPDESSPQVEPLFRAFTGSLFHDAYVNVLSMLQTQRSSTRDKKARKKARQTSATATPDSSVSQATSAHHSPTVAVPSYTIFSPSLSNALTNLEAGIEPLVTDWIISRCHVDADAHSSRVIALFHLVKDDLWRSVGLSMPAAPARPSAADEPDLVAAPIRPLLDSAPVDRHKLPCQTIIAGDGSTGDLPIPGSTFSLCCAPDGRNSTLPCECGIPPLSVDAPSDETGSDKDPDDAYTSPSSTQPVWTKVKSKPKCKKKGGKSKR